MVNFKALNTELGRDVQSALGSWYELALAPVAGNCPGLRGHVNALLLYSTDMPKFKMPKFKRKELRPRLFMGRV